METIRYNGKTIEVPQALEELTQEQYLRYLDIALMLDAGQIDALQARLKLLTLFLHLPVDVSMMPHTEWERYVGLLPLTETFATGRGEWMRLELRTGVNLIPEWEGTKGPGDMLNGVSFGTFIHCSNLLHDLAKADAEGKQQLMREVCERLYPEAKHPTPLLRAHACLFFLNVIDIMKSEALEIEGVQVEFFRLFNDAKKPARRGASGASVGWTTVAMDIAETGVFGSYRQVLDTPMWDVFIFLVHKQKKAV